MKGWIWLVVVGVSIGLAGLRFIHPFLAVNAPNDSPWVVVEGWVPPPALEKVVARYRDRPVSILFTTGGPREQAYDSDRIEDTAAAEAARFLTAYGFPADRLRVVPSWKADRDRTYSSALALRDWCRSEGVEVTSLEVVSEGPHARRSRLMFQRAFGPAVDVGIVAIPNHEYDPAAWWRYSEGVKSVISEAAAYVAACLLIRA
jgi:uncharacterized SAM-binding protein YcdF (DUF218 family)